jgi:hypothetical protein
MKVVFDYLALMRRKIRLKEGNANCRHLNKFTCKGTLRQVLNRVYRLDISSFLCTFSLVGIFNPALGSVFCTLLCCPSPLLSDSTLPTPPHLPCLNKYTLYMYTMCKWGGGVWDSGPLTETPAAKSLYMSIFLDDDIFLWFLYS